MIWLTFTLIAGVVNIIVMQMFAASQLGRTPVLLPLFLAVLSFIFAIGSAVYAIAQRNKIATKWLPPLAAAPAWLLLVVYNLWMFSGVLMVA